MAGNPIYLTDERWEHIRMQHPVLADREAAVRETIRKGRRRQDAMKPGKYFYRHRVPDLPGRATHIVAVVLFRLDVSEDGVLVENNYVATAYPKHIR
ncbi:MAG TPA: hypothetical protein VFJ16_00160 [Longimicrobium sp.]|nr:hypothetical protein [Longimicrobium sp.]